MFAKVKPNTQIIGQNLVYFASLNSTNSFAIELFRHNLAENGTVICTDNQTEGRGQMQKEWRSNAYENLIFSIIIKPVTNTISNSFLLNKAITLAVFSFIKEILPDKEVHIKWPNDIMVNNKKIAGILVENSYSGHQLNVSIVGIGLNVNQNFIDEPIFNATSLSDLKNEILDRSELLELLLEHIDKLYLQMIKNETDFINNEFNRQLLGFDIENNFYCGNDTLRAKIIGCDAEGRLILDNNGEIKSYLHGEIKQQIGL